MISADPRALKAEHDLALRALVGARQAMHDWLAEHGHDHAAWAPHAAAKHAYLLALIDRAQHRLDAARTAYNVVLGELHAINRSLS